MEQCENTQSEVVVDKGIHVTSTGMISVYSSTLSTATYEAANILPTSTLRDDYVLLTYPADRYGCVFAIVATEDNTTVDIVLTSPTYNGASAGDTLTVNLQYAGQVYQVFQQYENSSYPMNNFRDITGTRVHSRNCKPIAVFNGDVCVYIPYFITGQTCDLVYEQCIPPEYWGRKYIVPFLPFNSYDGHPNYVRVTALYDSTLVTRNNGESVLVNAGESYDFQIIRNNTTVADVVDASLPVSVNLYFASSDNTNGDPSMLNISPIEQRVDNVTFVCRSTQNTQNHKVNVILRTDERHLFRLDGSAHSDEFSVVTEDITYSSAIFNLSAGSHTMSMNGGSGFVGHVFGIGRRESYAYSVGSRLYSMTNTLYVNDVQVRQSDTVMGCKGDTLAFKVKHDSNINYVVWNIDGTFLVGDSVNYTFPTLGTREVVAYLSRTEPTCFSTDDTLRTFVNIHGQDTTMMDTAVCNFPFVWFGNQYTESDTLEHHLQNTFGCDSLLLLNIELTDEGKDTTITRIVRIPEKEATGQDELVLVQNAHARIGIDLASLSKDDLRINKSAKAIEIKLPDVKCLDFIMNPTDTDVFSEKGTWDLDQLKLAMAPARQEIEYKMNKDTMLFKKARKGAEDVITQYGRLSERNKAERLRFYLCPRQLCSGVISDPFYQSRNGACRAVPFPCRCLL